MTSTTFPIVLSYLFTVEKAKSLLCQSVSRNHDSKIGMLSISVLSKLDLVCGHNIKSPSIIGKSHHQYICCLWKWLKLFNCCLVLEQTLNKTKAKTGNGMFIPTLKEARENGQLMGRMGRLKHGRWLHPRIGEDKLRESLCKGRSPVCSQQADWFCAFLQFIYSLAIGFLLGIFLRNCIWIINNSCLMFLGKKITHPQRNFKNILILLHWQSRNMCFFRDFWLPPFQTCRPNFLGPQSN